MAVRITPVRASSRCARRIPKQRAPWRRSKEHRNLHAAAAAMVSCAVRIFPRDATLLT